jgi:hypothetical protein
MHIQPIFSHSLVYVFITKLYVQERGGKKGPSIYYYFKGVTVQRVPKFLQNFPIHNFIKKSKRYHTSHIQRSRTFKQDDTYTFNLLYFFVNILVI